MVYELHVSVTVTLIVISLTVYSIVLAIFAFRNPDPKSCYFFPGLDQPSRDQDLLLKTALEQLDVHTYTKLVKQGYPLNMANVFRKWFQWGFYSISIPMVLVAVTYLTNIRR